MARCATSASTSCATWASGTRSARGFPIRFLLTFLALFLPLALLLWFAQSDTPPPEALPDQPAGANDPALISTDELGASGFVARIVQLEGVHLQLIHKDKIRCYAKLGKLVRHKGRPRVNDVLIALFDGGKLQMTLESPYAEGDLAEFLSKEEGPKIVSFGGGVVVRDPQGRERARIDRLDLDLDQQVLRSTDRVSMRLADEDVELSADGFFADLSKKRREARVGGNVTLTAPTGGGIGSLRCKGPATLTEQAAGEYLVTLSDEAVIEHPLAKATCDRIVALLKKRGKRHELVRTVLKGKVAIDIEAEQSGGLRSVRAALVTLEGEHQILLRRLTAVRQGPVPALGPEDRTVDLKADRAALTLLRENDALKVWEVSLKGGVEARDRHGPAYLLAQSLLFNEATRVFEASGGVEAKTPTGFVRTRRLRVEGVAEGEYDLILSGASKRVEYTVDGKLGPLGKGRRGKLVVTAAGPLRAAVRKKSTLFGASDKVRVELGGDARLECERLTLSVYEGDLSWLEARDRVVLAEGGRGAELRGDALLYRDKFALLRGSPARIRSEELGTVRARVIAYQDGGEFVARDGVALVTRLVRGEGVEQWRIYCREARGVLRKKGPPEFIEAYGTVIAMGPEHQHFTGAFLRFDGASGEAVLRGEPAVLQRGKELRFTAPQIDLRIKDKQLASAQTLWPATVELRPKPREAAGRTFARWFLRLKKGARFSGDRLVAPAGAAFTAFDKQGVRQISGTVGHATVFLRKEKERWKPVRLLCTKRIRAQLHGKEKATVTADRLGFLVGKREVDLRGNARVKAKGWAPEASFQHLVFVLTKDGVDLKRASEISVRDPRR